MPVSQAKGEPKKPKEGVLDDPFRKDIAIAADYILLILTTQTHEL